MSLGLFRYFHAHVSLRSAWPDLVAIVVILLDRLKQLVIFVINDQCFSFLPVTFQLLNSMFLQAWLFHGEVHFIQNAPIKTKLGNKYLDLPKRPGIRLYCAII